jgi:hypothetical protein
MPIVYTYPTVTPASDDLLLLSDTSDSRKITKSATIESVIDLVGTNITTLTSVIEVQRHTVGDLSIGTVGGGNVEINADSGDIDLTTAISGGVNITPISDIDIVPTDGDVNISPSGVARKVNVKPNGEVDISPVAGKTKLAGTGDLEVNNTGDVYIKSSTMRTPDSDNNFVLAARNTSGKADWRRTINWGAKELSAAGIQNLHITPIEILPAPGPDYAIQILEIYAKANFNGVAFPTGQKLQIHFAGLATNMLYSFTSGLVDAAADLRAVGDRQNDARWALNTAIQASLPGSAGVGGDTTISLYYTYITYQY